MNLPKPKIKSGRMLNESFAKWYQELPALPSERRCEDAHVAKIASEMRAGMFMEDIATICTVEVEGITYKLNGQHTCAAYLQLNDDARPFQVMYRHYVAQSLAEAAQLYARFDAGWSARRFDHIAGAIWSTDGTLEKFGSRKFLSLASGAIAFSKANSSFSARSQINGTNRINLPKLHLKDLALMYEIAGDNAEAMHMRRDPVFCAIYKTILLDRDAAKQFWTDVRDGVGLPSKEDPRKRLEVYLRKAMSNLGRRASKTADATRKASNREIYAKCVHFWNAWRDGRTTDGKFYPAAPLPIPH